MFQENFKRRESNDANDAANVKVDCILWSYDHCLIICTCSYVNVMILVETDMFNIVTSGYDI